MLLLVGHPANGTTSMQVAECCLVPSAPVSTHFIASYLQEQLVFGSNPQMIMQHSGVIRCRAWAGNGPSHIQMLCVFRPNPDRSAFVRFKRGLRQRPSCLKSIKSAKQTVSNINAIVCATKTAPLDSNSLQVQGQSQMATQVQKPYRVHQRPTLHHVHRRKLHRYTRPLQSAAALHGMPPDKQTNGDTDQSGRKRISLAVSDEH